mmetsp:Transcript_22671/g.25800  ORF Transcript_22671/g.25800 Transcript_22671/m.25800 type:complete len:212 (-) Transcript_22671:107-742(-)|eukprot:CAMPEP_0194131362 /NCGR_PEP_ID=MMETSP0152-20130528/2159_1 /TAXON_ID=1049557 /ORGANISM="Thalassiothrix antarctica, Strain L6-D1" /LENGTH=211 /DNA_ID=CAMNT_0038826127 /DNA_START=34 /DNA_END=669 /DNA_ORIENTATION=-
MRGSSLTTIFLLIVGKNNVNSFNIFHDKSKLFQNNGIRNNNIQLASSSSSSGDKRVKIEVDVSDLGLTMKDLEAPLPSELLQGITTTGYESTSRIESVQDNGCSWTESSDRIKVTLAIPGLRGQPAMALSVISSTNTVSVSAFGRIVWSCILRGEVKPQTVVFETKDGSDMIPVIEYTVEKESSSSNDNNETGQQQRWGGFILQIGEDSIL